MGALQHRSFQARRCSITPQPHNLAIPLGQSDRPFGTFTSNIWSSRMFAYFNRLVMSAATVLVLCPVDPTVAAAAEWIPLFDGKRLERCEKLGQEESDWEVQNGAIRRYGGAS